MRSCKVLSYVREKRKKKREEELKLIMSNAWRIGSAAVEVFTCNDFVSFKSKKWLLIYMYIYHFACPNFVHIYNPSFLFSNCIILSLTLNNFIILHLFNFYFHSRDSIKNMHLFFKTIICLIIILFFGLFFYVL